jgi:hypothetical protein
MAWRKITLEEFNEKYYFNMDNMKVQRVVEGKDGNGRFIIIIIKENGWPVLKYKAHPDFSYVCWESMYLGT